MLICVTNRKLCKEDFLLRIQRLAQARPYALMLREKDLDVSAYEELAWRVKEVCEQYGVQLIIHQHSLIAKKLHISHLHLPMPILRTLPRDGHSLIIGASIHSVAEAEEAQALGVNYLIAGHIYATDSKKGVPPRGVPFLRQVCQAVSVPVFAIGGIDSNNTTEICKSGAKGFCVMSDAMTCKEPEALVATMRLLSPVYEGMHNKEG